MGCLQRTSLRTQAGKKPPVPLLLTGKTRQGQARFPHVPAVSWLPQMLAGPVSASSGRPVEGYADARLVASREQRVLMRRGLTMRELTDVIPLLAFWDSSPVVAAWRAATGTIHTTFLLQTAERTYALRAYRYTTTDRWRIGCEHALSTFVAAHGLPAITPCPLLTGDTVLEQDGHFYALFPYANGQQIARAQLTEQHLAVMGRMLARLHRVLQTYPHERVPHRSFPLEPTATQARIEALIQVIEALPERTEEDEQVVRRLHERHAWLNSAPIPDLTSFFSGERQVIHGDYQETNLFFDDGQVSAIIDWDQAYVVPRAWEVVRTLHYVGKLEVSACHPLLSAYQAVFPVSQSELEQAARAYGTMRDHDLWHYEAVYLHGNARVRAFLQPGPFVSFAQRWQHLSPTLLC